MKKRISLLLSLVMLLELVVPAFAENQSENQETTATYYVEVPVSMSPGGTDEVRVWGSWGTAKKLTVTADSSVTLKNEANSEAEGISLGVTFDGVEEVGTNVVEETDPIKKSISVASLSSDHTPRFGNWKGTIHYTVDMTDAPVQRTLTKIEVSKKPCLDYYSLDIQGYEFNNSFLKFIPDGMELLATYSDGTTETVTEGYTYSPTGDFTHDDCGIKTMTIYYGGLSCPLEVRVWLPVGMGGNVIHDGVAAQFNNGSLKEDIYIYCTHNRTMTWEAISMGTESRPFKGRFSGRGLMSHVTMGNAAVFGYLGDGAIIDSITPFGFCTYQGTMQYPFIKNASGKITIADVAFQMEHEYFGSKMAQIRGNYKQIIETVSENAAITLENIVYKGIKIENPLFGTVGKGATVNVKSITFEDCTFSGISSEAALFAYSGEGTVTVESVSYTGTTTALPKS